ncbi:hypothetical protein [Vannielia litorea]|uniref:hypothetical protein n=1 Tax=Vannielia litorea TaxID=1217970 RepID=UPI003F87F9A7
MEAADHAPVEAFTPYWDRQGRPYEDADGYRVVLQNAAWDNQPASACRIRRTTGAKSGRMASARAGVSGAQR